MNNREPIKIGLVHLVYLLIISVLIMATVITLNFVGEETLDQKITFAATLISIIIGALAIFIAVYQGLTQSTSVEKLQDASDRVERVTKTLEGLGEISEKIEKIDKSLNEADFKTMHAKLNVFEDLDISALKVSSSDNKVALSENQFKFVYSYLIIETNFNYFVLKCYKLGKPVSVYEHVMHMVDSGVKDYKLTNAPGHAGYFVIMFTKYILVEGFELDEFNVKSVPAYFEKVVTEAINPNTKQIIDSFFDAHLD